MVDLKEHSNAIKLIIRYSLAFVFAIVTYHFVEVALQDTKNVLQQILVAVYGCIAALTSIATILLLRK